MKTTRETVKQEIHRNLVKQLQDLLETNYDAEKGYKKALKHTQDSGLKDFIKKQAFLHGHFATELDKQIHMLNEHPKTEGSLVGIFHRTWIDLISSFYDKDDNIVLEECLRGERNTLREYDEKLEKCKFPVHVREVLQKQQEELRQSISGINSVEDLTTRTDRK